MKRTSEEMKTYFNELLLMYNQSTKIKQWTSLYILLENGMLFEKNERIKFIRRLTSKKTTIWIENIDNLLAGNVSENELKFFGRSKGGKQVQLQHSNIIKNNLNCGIPWNKGMKNMYTTKPMLDETKSKIGNANRGMNNGMYGVSMSDERKQQLSNLMKQLILTGKFTPNSNNRNTHWNSELNGKKYRSSWEALYHYINPIAEYETFRIEYTLHTVSKIYIVDFIDTTNRVLVEVKPKELCVGEKFNAKINALTTWATTNNYTVLIVDKEWLISNLPLTIDYLKFDNNTKNKIKKLYEINKTQ
jgi:NUMOD3 motif